ncbi:MAG: PQQ-like beta-propeller repeat protein, partial [Chloroflexota bacterium]|nr:PQQ-like beta-propeller repeat protein [Chloroflexota bacterium]
MREVEPQSEKNFEAGIPSGEPEEGLPLTSLPQHTTTARPRLLRFWLVGGTLFLVLAIILASVLSFHHQASTPVHQTPLQKPTLSQPSHPRHTVIPTPVSPPISSPVSTDHNVIMTITGGVSYVGTFDNAVYALSISNGTVLWHYKTNGSVEEKPLVVDGVVYVSAYAGNAGPGTIYALRAHDGSLLWHYTST